MGSIEKSFEFENENAAIFEIDEGQIWLNQLFDLACGFGNKNLGSFRTRGLGVLDTSVGRFEADRLVLKKSNFDENKVSLTFSAGESLRLESEWRLCNDTGIWSRKDTLFNDGEESISIRRCLARFSFSPGVYEFFSQGSVWCNENQGIWQDLRHGGVVLGCEGGRTTQGGTPYMCLRDKDSGKGVAFHIIPRGNWVIKIRACTPECGVHLPYIVAELGQSDESLDIELAANGSFELPEILIQSLPNGQVETAAPNLQKYVLNKYFSTAKKTAPVIYNTWFDVFECLDVDRLGKQLAAAKEIGCEIFVVDAGWYGQGEGPWSQQIGDWREKLDGAFYGKMNDFADKVRGAGLKFGLWMEPERNFATVPAVKENPSWFLPGGGGCFYPDLSQQQVYNYILSEMSRLVETYELAWMKVDYNFELGSDPTELAGYYEQWYKLLDALRQKYPQTYFEGCTSGGLRLDINALSHFDGHFLSDNINPSDALRMYQQAILRLPPGRIGKWIGLRSVGKTIAQYAVPIEKTPVSIVTPAGCGAMWEKSETVSVDFAVRVALCGMPGFSGDIASLPDDAKKRIAEHMIFYKKWREFITASIAHLLTPVKLKSDHLGWAAIQLQQPGRSENLLFVYRLDDALNEKRFQLLGLDPEQTYSILNPDKDGEEAKKLTGLQLMNHGINVTVDNRYDAAVFVISAWNKGKNIAKKTV